MSEAAQARRYEATYPGALTDEAQKAARQDRIEFKARQSTGRRGSRYVTVPDLPWKRESA